MTVIHSNNLLSDYRPPDGAYDEFVRAGGALRSHWSHVGPALSDLGHGELLERQNEVDRLLDSDGVTYNAFGNADPRGRRWALDPLPVVIDSKDWSTIERGVIQRAELLAMILADLYGPRELLRRKLLPIEVVLGHPGFLRPCDQRAAMASGSFAPTALTTYAVDIGRNAEGESVALSDRAQAPSGAGYALENRLVISRVFPSMYRDAQVHRVAPFFRALRRSLQKAAPHKSDPRIVVMSPGPWSETAFEHAYLASYLGYPLVEGGDLTVQGGSVWMRSLGRLEPVDVILRRVDDWYCDPLELKPDSQLGVAGLVDVARRGAVSIVNPLGSGIIESPAILAFLPAIAEHFLGQSLRLPSVETFWCGDASSRQHVLTNLHELVVKPIAREAGTSMLLGWELSSAALSELKDRIGDEPWRWTAQVPLPLSTTPTLTEHGFESRRSVLRAFAVSQGDSYTVMPGGLLRVAPEAHSSLISNQAGALTKDAWVLASEPEQLSGFWLNNGPVVEAVDPVGSMPSRAAENLFWLGRYAERAEGVVRLLRVVADRRNDFSNDANPAGSRCLELLLRALTTVTTTYPGFTDHDKVASPGDELFSLIVDVDRLGSLAHAVRHMLDSAYAVRDQLSSDTWLVIGNLDREILELRAPGIADRQGAAQNSLSRAMQSLLALAGLAGESMVRDPGWHFMDAGRRIERAIQLTALLRATLGTENDRATDSLLIESVLTTAESIITYRRRYRSQAQVQTALDLLLLDRGNPRSLFFQLERLQTDIANLPRKSDGTATDRLSAEERLVLEATTSLQLADTAAMAGSTATGERPELDAFLERLHNLLRRAADAIDAEHFARQLPQQHFGTVR